MIQKTGGARRTTAHPGQGVHHDKGPWHDSNARTKEWGSTTPRVGTCPWATCPRPWASETGGAETQTQTAGCHGRRVPCTRGAVWASMEREYGDRGTHFVPNFHPPFMEDNTQFCRGPKETMDPFVKNAPPFLQQTPWAKNGTRQIHSHTTPPPSLRPLILCQTSYADGVLQYADGPPRPRAHGVPQHAQTDLGWGVPRRFCLIGTGSRKPVQTNSDEKSKLCSQLENRPPHAHLGMACPSGTGAQHQPRCSSMATMAGMTRGEISDITNTWYANGIYEKANQKMTNAQRVCVSTAPLVFLWENSWGQTNSRIAPIDPSWASPSPPRGPPGAGCLPCVSIVSAVVG